MSFCRVRFPSWARVRFRVARHSSSGSGSVRAKEVRLLVSLNAVACAQRLPRAPISIMARSIDELQSETGMQRGPRLFQGDAPRRFRAILTILEGFVLRLRTPEVGDRFLAPRDASKMLPRASRVRRSLGRLVRNQTSTPPDRVPVIPYGNQICRIDYANMLLV